MRFLRFIKGRPVALISLVILIIMYSAMAAAPLIAPMDPTKTFEGNSFHPANVELTRHGLVVREYRCIDKSRYMYARVTDKSTIHPLHFFNRNKGSSNESYPMYLLGADNLGRDLLSRIIYGSRISLTIGFVATAISLFLAILFGGVSGYFGAAADWFIMRFAEFFMLIPSLYFILFLRSLLNTRLSSGSSYMIITVILSLVGWPASARTIRGMVLSIKTQSFVSDAQLSGVPSFIIIVRHIIPQMASLLIVSIALSVPGFIMSETTLSYLGLGISDPSVSWGSLINRDISTLSNLINFPWLLWPAAMLLLVTLAFNFLGDALRDYFDPSGGNSNSGGFDTILHKQSKRAKGLCKITQPPNVESETLPLKSTSCKTPPARCPILSINNLTVAFSNKVVVKDVSFELSAGEILGVVGESGSGKSVTTTAIVRLLGNNATINGSVLYNTTAESNGFDTFCEKQSEEAKDLSQNTQPPIYNGDGAFIDIMLLSPDELRAIRGSEIALVTQEPSRAFDPLQTIGSAFHEAIISKDMENSEHIAAHSVFSKSDLNNTRKNSDAIAIKLLEEVGIQSAAERLKNYPHQFSGGQLQRVAIALALVQNPKVLIADEITTALDVTTQAQIVKLLLKLKSEHHLSIIFITHNIDLIAKISDRVLVMYDGRAVECADTYSIMNKAQHPYTRALLASVVDFGEHYTKGAMRYITQKDRENFTKV